MPPLEPTPDELREMIDAAAERVVDHLATLGDQPAMDLDDAEAVAAKLHAPEPPEHGEPLEPLLDRVLDEAVPKSLNAPHPGYLAYIPGGGLTDAIVADMIADATNRYTGVRAAAPALVQLEADVVDWFCEILGYPDGSGGTLTSGGSLANQTAVTTARIDRLGEIRDGVIYASDQTHHSLRKAARLAGFDVDQVRAVPSTDAYRIDVDALEAAIDDDREAGREPFLVVGNAGTTNTGAVDDLHALAALCDADDLWLHVDAAYGGFFAMTDRGADRLDGISRADSITLDPHKSLFLPYGVGSLIVRDVETLRTAHSLPASYLPEEGETRGVDFSHLSPELTRPYRGLKVWLAIRHHGLAAFRDALDEKLDLARWAADALAAIDDVDVVAEPELSILAFRLEPEGADAETVDALNRDLLETVNGYRNVHISGTTLDGVFTPRLAIGSFRTHRDTVEQAVADVRRAAETVR